MGLVDQSVLDQSVVGQSVFEQGVFGQSVLEGGISTAEAARVLGLNVQTVRKYIWRGKLPAVPVQCRRGFRWRVLVDESSAGAAMLSGDEPGVDGADEGAARLDGSLDRVAALANELARVQGRLGLAKEELEEIRRRVRVVRQYEPA